MKALITIIILALVAWGVYAFIHKDNMPQGYTQTTNNAQGSDYTPSIDTSASTSTSSPAVIPETKSFTVSGSNYKFSPSTLSVNKGDKVRITFQNSGGTHDWNLDEFNAHTKILSGGQSEVVEFTADKTGSFEYYCSVGNHRQMGMKGTLTVK
jgi:plastocyanin